MITDLLTILILGIVCYELIEHLLFPLVWMIVQRGKKSPCGAEGIPGRLVEVRDWRDGEGRVFLNGEIWRAVSSDPLLPGDKALVRKVDGLTLTVEALGKPSGTDSGRH